MSTDVGSSRSSAVALYRYHDIKGGEHLVDSLEEVPAALRAHVTAVTGGVPIEKRTVIDMTGEDLAIKSPQIESVANQGLARAEKAWFGSAWGGRINLSSLVLGAGMVVVLLISWSALKRRPGRIVKVILALVIAASVGSIYLLSWLKSIPGGSAAPMRLSSPVAIVDQARQTVDDASRRARAQQTALDQIDTQQK